MLVQVRTGYSYTKLNRRYIPGDRLELSEEEYGRRPQIFEAVTTKVSAEPVEIADDPEDEPTQETRAIGVETGKPIIPSRRARKAK